MDALRKQIDDAFERLIADNPTSENIERYALYTGITSLSNAFYVRELTNILFYHVFDSCGWQTSSNLKTILEVYAAKIASPSQIPLRCPGYNPFAEVRAEIDHDDHDPQISDRNYIIKICERIMYTADASATFSLFKDLCAAAYFHLIPLNEISHRMYIAPCPTQEGYLSEKQMIVILRIIDRCTATAGEHTKPALSLEPQVCCLMCLEVECQC